VILATEKRVLFTVITEATLEQPLLRELDRLGVRGYTISDARGKGNRGVRDAAWGETANIRIEVICTRELAERVLEFLHKHYYANYAMVTFVQDVEVIRLDKF
jgi:nitrogen regulatory protein PII